jgi:hypothetical protein
MLFPAFPSAQKPVCVDTNWCAEKRDHSMVNIVVVRFDLNDADSSKVRFVATNDWVSKNNKTIQEMGE